MPTYTIEVSERVAEFVPPEECAALLDAEALRRWHVRRCAPKPKTDKFLKNQQVLQVRKRGKHLLEVYSKLQKMYGDEFEKLHGEMYHKLTAAIEAGDLDTVLWFEREQPWMKRNGRS